MSSLVMRFCAVPRRSRGTATLWKEVLVTLAALVAMVALVVIVRVGGFALLHADQPLYRDLLARILS